MEDSLVYGRTPPHQSCRGPVSRRDILRLGLAGLASLTWPGLLRLRAEARLNRPRAQTALLVVWLHGGASHLETYDPKPDAPSEYRGPYRPIATTVPGMRISELLPEHARLARRFTLLRSLAHTGPCHDSGPQQLFTSFPTTVNRLKPDHPDCSPSWTSSVPTRPEPCRTMWAFHPSRTWGPPTWGRATSRSRSTATPTTPSSKCPTSA